MGKDGGSFSNFLVNFCVEIDVAADGRCKVCELLHIFKHSDLVVDGDIRLRLLYLVL